MQEIRHFKVGILRGESCPLPPKSWNFQDVISYDSYVCTIHLKLVRLLLVFSTTSYVKIESCQFGILVFECIKISQIIDYPKGETVAKYQRGKLQGSTSYDPYAILLKFTTAT